MALITNEKIVNLV